MTKKEAGQSVYDIAIEVAKEMNDADLKDGIEHLRDHHLVHVARAKAVFDELTSGLPDIEEQGDGVDYLDAIANRLNSVIRENLDADSIFQFLSLCGVRLADLRASNKGRRNAEIRHSQTGGSREKQAQIKVAWASGKFASRDICADQESAGLNMSPSTARKALRNTPNPTASA